MTGAASNTNYRRARVNLQIERY